MFVQNILVDCNMKFIPPPRYFPLLGRCQRLDLILNAMFPDLSISISVVSVTYEDVVRWWNCAIRLVYLTNELPYEMGNVINACLVVNNDNIINDSIIHYMVLTMLTSEYLIKQWIRYSAEYRMFDISVYNVHRKLLDYIFKLRKYYLIEDSYLNNHDTIDIGYWISSADDETLKWLIEYSITHNIRIDEICSYVLLHPIHIPSLIPYMLNYTVNSPIDICFLIYRIPPVVSDEYYNSTNELQKAWLRPWLISGKSIVSAITGIFTDLSERVKQGKQISGDTIASYLYEYKGMSSRYDLLHRILDTIRRLGDIDLTKARI